MNLIRISAKILSIFILASCGSTTQLLSSQIEFTPEPQRAYIAGTYSVDCKPLGDNCVSPFQIISVFYRNSSNTESRGWLDWDAGNLFGGGSPKDYTSKEVGEKGYYFCVPLPAGEYEFFTYELKNFAPGSTSFYLDKNRYFNLPFTLKAGEVIDIGKLHIKFTTTPGFLGYTFTTPGFIELGKNSPSMLQAALEKCPVGVRNRPVRDSSLVEVLRSPHPAIRPAKADRTKE